MSINPSAGAIVLLACAMALPGCATETKDKPETERISGGASDSLVVDAQANGETRLRRGQLLAIQLDSNASTGYGWEIVEDGSPVLEPAPVPANPAPPVSSMPGAGGISRWRFRAVRPGTATVRLIYRRSWEKGVEPVRTASYIVRVE